MVKVVADLDDFTLSQLRVNQHLIDAMAQAVAQAVAQQLHQEAQPYTPPPQWTAEERKIDDLIHDEDMERMLDQGHSFGSSYTIVERNGEEVLHLLSEYYTDSVLEAAKEDDLHPLPSEGLSVSTIIYFGDQYAAKVPWVPNNTFNTLEAINRNFDVQENTYKNVTSLTNSSQPRISWPIYEKGVREARKNPNSK